MLYCSFKHAHNSEEQVFYLDWGACVSLFILVPLPAAIES